MFLILLVRRLLLIGLVAVLPALAVAANVQIDTSLGKIVVTLDKAKAPQTTANFEQYVKEGFYKNTVFHRVIPGFMIQGGGFDDKMQQKPTRAPIKNEAANGLKNQRGSIAMARTGDPHSATAQFFINVADNAMLDYPSRDGWGYAVFGQVVSGMEVVDAIVAAPVKTVGPHQNVPQTPIVIRSIKLLSD